MTPMGRFFGSSHLFSPDSTTCVFPFVHLALHPFAVIHYSAGYYYMLNPVSLPKESSNLGVSLKNPPLPPETTNASTWVLARQRVQRSDVIASVL